MYRFFLALLFALLCAGCLIPDIELEGLPCPCAKGYACVANRCLKVDGGVPAGGDGGSGCAAGQTRSCEAGDGCPGGEQVCRPDGTWSSCRGELCAELQAGVCAGARHACTNGGWASACTPEDYGPDYEPAETRCDGQDNDCNGKTDDVAAENRPLCPEQDGACQGARQACVSSAWTACADADYLAANPAWQAVETTCDAIDNDCDGLTDEDLLGAACDKQAGVCAGALQGCVAGAFESPCAAASYGADYAAQEKCDGLDNDCNGLTDEGFECALGAIEGPTCSFTGPALPACESRKICVSGCTWSCAAPVESCNLQDDNCNGSADEGITSGPMGLKNGVKHPALQGLPHGAGFLASYVSTSATGSVFLQRISPTPTAEAEKAVVRNVASPRSPAVSTHHVAWIEGDGPHLVRAAPLAASTFQPRAPLVVSTATTSAPRALVAMDIVESGAPGTLLAWEEGGVVKLARLVGATLVSTETVSVAGDALSSPALGSVGTTPLVAFELDGERIGFAAADGSHANLGSWGGGTWVQPAMTEDAVVHLVRDTCSSTTCPPGHSGQSSKVVLSRLSVSSGQVNQLEPLSLTDPATLYAEAPRIATLGQGSYLVVWRVPDAGGTDGGPSSPQLGLVLVNWEGATWSTNRRGLGFVPLQSGTSISVAHAASDGVRFGIILDALGATSSDLYFRNTCP